MAKIGDKFIIEIGEVFHGDVVPDTAIYKDHELYRVKEFNSLVFDENGLNKLKKYNNNAEKEAFEHGYSQGLEKSSAVEKEQAYQQGLNDAWEAATRIVLEGGKNDLSPEELEEIFKTRSLPGIFASYSAAEAIAKIKAYEEQKKAEERKSHLCNSYKYLYPECPSSKDDATFGEYTDSIIKCHKYEQKKAEEEIKVNDEIYSEMTDTKAVVVFFDSWGRWQCLSDNGFFTVDDDMKKYWVKTSRHFDIEGILKTMREE